jgi:hypothetical protein
MAREYRAVAEKAPAPVTARVRAVCEAVFEVTASLNKKTLVSLVAGETTGRLYERMKEAAVSAIRIGAEIARTADPEEARLLEEELEKLAQAAENMRRRRLELERGGSTRPSSEIADDIDYLAQRAEKLIREVRPLDSRYSEKYRID